MRPTGRIRSSIPTICVVGRSGVGKTTLLENLIRELKRRGYQVATVKHHHQPGLEIDQPGKDSWRHAQAGSDFVVIVAPDKLASIRRVNREPTLDEVLAGIRGVDLILVEGYKGADKPKIEVVRAEYGLEPVCAPDELLAIASDVTLPSYNTSHFNLEDVVGLANLLETHFLN